MENMMDFFKSRVLSKRQGSIFEKTYTVWHSLQIVWRRQNSTDNFCIELGKKINLTWKIVNKKSKIAIKPYFLLSIYDGMGWFWIVSTHWSRILPSRTAKVDIFSDFHGFCHFFDFFFKGPPKGSPGAHVKIDMAIYSKGILTKHKQNPYKNGTGKQAKP